MSNPCVSRMSFLRRYRRRRKCCTCGCRSCAVSPNRCPRVVAPGLLAGSVLTPPVVKVTAPTVVAAQNCAHQPPLPMGDETQTRVSPHIGGDGSPRVGRAQPDTLAAPPQREGRIVVFHAKLAHDDSIVLRGTGCSLPCLVVGWVTESHNGDAINRASLEQATGPTTATASTVVASKSASRLVCPRCCGLGGAALPASLPAIVCTSKPLR